MAILNFMPQFAPWYTKVLLKKKDDPDAVAATESSTGFFGDVFDFIDDGFNWAATAVEEPAIQYEEPPQYYDAPVAPPEPFYDVPPQYYDEPVQDFGGGFGSAIGDIFNGSGEGMGFDLINEPTDAWASQNTFTTPQSDYGWDSEMGGGMGFEPQAPPVSDWMPTTPPPVSDWGSIVSEPVRDWNLDSGFDNWDFNTGLPAALNERYPNDQAWADVQDWRNAPQDNLDTTEFDYTATGSAPIMGALDQPDPIGWGDISSMFEEARPKPVQTWDIPGMENPATGIPGWYSMSPDERGEYVWQSGLEPEAYLSDMDIASLSPDVRFKLNLAGNNPGMGSWLKDAGMGALNTVENIGNQFAMLNADTWGDTLGSSLDIGKGPAALLPAISKFIPGPVGSILDDEYADPEIPLNETIPNAIESGGNPIEFAQLQNADFKTRPWWEQVAYQMLNPGGGLVGSTDDANRFIRGISKVGDAADLGPVFGKIGDIPGAGTFAKNVLLPAAVGGTGGALTEAVFDPSYTDPFGNEYDPNMLESILGGAAIGLGGRAAMKAGTVPFGAGIEDVGRSADELANLIDESPVPGMLNATDEFTGLPSVSEAPDYIPRGSILDESDRITAPSIADEGLSTVPSETAYTPPKKMTAAQKKLPIAEQRAILGDPPATNQQGYLTWIDENNRINALEHATPEWRAKNIETITPANDTVIGKNDLGEDVYERANDGLRYTIRDGKVRTGGNLAVVEDEGLSTIPTGIADEAVTPAPSTPLVERAVNHVDAILRDRAMTAAERRTEFVKRNSDILAAQQDALGDAAGEDAARAILKGERMDVFAPEVPRLTEAQGAELRDLALAKARAMGYGNVSSYQITDAIRSLIDGTNANPSELRTLRNVLTDTPYQQAADTIETVAPKADEIIRRPNARIVDDAIEPGMEKPISQTIDEIAKAPLAPEDKAIIGADDGLFANVDEVSDEGEFQPNDWWDNVTKADAPATGKTPEWKKLADDIADWRSDNMKDFDAIGIDDKSSWAQRKVGGALKNKLADTLTSRGRDLDMYLQSQGRTFEESKDMVERELADYLNGRMVREAKNGNKDAILEHALTALHMGDFQPKMDGIKVPTGTGQVPGALQTARTANAALKNMFFGIADVGAIMGNAVPAIMNQGPMVGLAYLNRIAKLVDIDDALKNREFSGLAMDQSQDVMSEDVGTLIGWAGRALGDKKGGAALRAIDRPFTKWNDVLSKAQFDLLMNKGLRQPAYEGNLVLLKLLGRDVNDPSLQRAAARMANAATSTAPLARGNTRRAAEGATLSSARYLRAQGDLLLAATKLINPKASLDERIIAASAIASVIAVSAAANELAGNRLDLNPFKGVNINPLKGDIDIKGAEFNPDFGKITLPDGTVIPFFRQKELAQTLLKTVAELDDLVKKDPTGIRDAWSRFIIGRTGPLGGTALKGLAKTGYDPVENTYSFPWEGEGFGSGMSPTQYALQMLPVPVGITGLLNSEGSNTSKGLNFIGGGTYPQGEYSAALKKYGVSSMEEFEKLDPDTFMTRKEKLYQENPELRAKFADSASAKIAESKVANSEKFMETKQMVGDWRETKDDLANQAKGAYNELGLEEKERPSTPGSAQWLWDYNNTFKAALEDLNNSSSEMNDEILGKLQADFWAKHPDPKVRKEILQYQILRAPTEADKLYARDMARLNGFDPDTGETLKIPGTDQPMPNYFNMDRYFWTEVPNDEAKQFDTKFDKWKLKQSDKVRDLTRAKQIDLYLATEDEVATRFNGKEWTPAAIKDVKNYGLPSKEDPIYSEYKQIMLPELLWFKPEQYWDNIKEAHDNRE